MPMSELQIGLIGAGTAAVAAIVVYNRLQERKHRRQVEKALHAEHEDVLLQPRAEPLERRVEPGDGDRKEAEARRPVAEVPAKRGMPELPALIDAAVDCVIRIECIEPLPSARLWSAQVEQLMGLSKPVRWFGLDDLNNHWIALSPGQEGAHHWYCVSMQMVDRHGPISESDLLRFADGVQRVAEAFMAIPATLPARQESLESAAQLDRFCAEVDIQIGVNVVAAGEPFAGTKIRGLAEAQGLRLEGDGGFHLRDEDGRLLFSLANLESPPFTLDNLRSLRTHALTLTLDVPRVANGGQAFDRMMLFAQQLASTLGGRVVDDNRAPFGDQAVSLIRSQIQQFQQRMQVYGIPAGSPLAMRLFVS